VEVPHLRSPLAPGSQVDARASQQADRGSSRRRHVLQRQGDGVGCRAPSLTALPSGTTAWRVFYGRHQVVEGVNAMLKGGFDNIQHKFFRVFGLAKMTLMLAFTLAGYNLAASVGQFVGMYVGGGGFEPP
jgi:hypothetical protein